MHLLLRRSQRDDGWLRSLIKFLLDARLDLSPELHELFERYRLYEVVIYDSDARVQHAYSATEHYHAAIQAAEAVPLIPPVGEIHSALGNSLASLWHLGAGATHSLLSMTSLQITLGSLVAGQHFESESLGEILTIAAGIKEAAEYLASYFDVALTFDGREDLSEH